MRIDVVYDFLCPWCFVAKRQLALAIAAERPAGLDVRWYQFMLYPDFDRAGHDFLAFFRKRYGEGLRVPMWDRIRAVAAPLGIHFAFERITRGPASIDGHRLVRWADRLRPGSAEALIEELSSGFFERAEVIDTGFLVSLAARHGFDGEAARNHIDSDDDLAAPFRETEAWRRRGVQSMPHYVLTFSDGTRSVIRHTSVQTFAQAFAQDRALRADSGGGAAGLATVQDY